MPPVRKLNLIKKCERLEVFKKLNELIFDNRNRMKGISRSADVGFISLKSTG
jgi:hypothetical protein